MTDPKHPATVRVQVAVAVAAEPSGRRCARCAVFGDAAEEAYLGRWIADAEKIAGCIVSTHYTTVLLPLPPAPETVEGEVG